MSWVDGNTRTFTAGLAIVKHLRVKITSTKLAIAGIGDGPGEEVGQVETETFADLDEVAVRLISASGTCKMVAAAAIVEGAPVYTAASGKVSVSASTAYPIGVAMEAAAADNDIIEVLRTGYGVVVS